MSSYDELVQRLPLPTPAQTRAFADHVATVRSWYKHLPLLKPGARFVFFLDAKAGTRHIMYPRTGENRHEVVTDPAVGHPKVLHTTREYLARCGHWQYFVTENRNYGDQNLKPFSFDHAGEELEINMQHQSMRTCELTAFLKFSPLLWSRFIKNSRPELGWTRPDIGPECTENEFLQAAQEETRHQHDLLFDSLQKVRLTLAQIQSGGEGAPEAGKIQ